MPIRPPENSTSDVIDAFWMEYALSLACDAAAIGEVPVGAVIVQDGEVVSTGFNRKETLPSATAHAELLAIEDACKQLGRWRLSGCTLYVTLEPCLMCVGAIVQARVDRVVYGTPDAKAGAVHSQYHIFEDGKLNHTPVITAGVLQPECGQILSGFFAELRKKKALKAT